ncbi:btb/poz domain-containing protein [Anaeramoeba flamelloides]|uniref:Btb/poz domain-containing protein n=1 Tax=Anaeramoeba flamelloides TaxID=1746091 RepID=A0AAV7ZY26_9EUKA|nr:btb/poz domain-containing protein [Anaeramoeba flamelloides]KAJ6252343.1 btb/poz domain-containing protein [Anaeramoeba flamelloides]
MLGVPIQLQIEQLFKSKHLSDVQLVFGQNKEIVHAHKFILILNSKYFEQEILKKQKNTQPPFILELPDLSKESFEEILTFLYTKKSTIKEDNVFSLLKLSSRFGILELEEHCVDFCLKSMCSNIRCLTLLQSAISLDHLRLLDRTEKYLEENSISILSQPQCLLEIDYQTIKVILENKRLRVGEIELFYRLEEKRKMICEQIDNFKKQGLQTIQLELLAKQLTECESLFKLIKVQLFSINQIKQISLSEPFQKGLIKLPDLESIENDEKKKNQIKNRFGEYVKCKESFKILLLVSTRDKKYIKDVSNSIRLCGMNKIEFINAQDGTPSLEDLMNYHSIFHFSNIEYHDPVLMGDNLAKFVASGRGLVMCTIHCFNGIKRNELKGKIMTDNFLPFLGGKQKCYNRRTLGNVLNLKHPIMKGISKFDCGELSLYIKPNQIDPKAEIIAEYDNGTPLIATKCKQEGFGHVVLLNFFPVSDNVWKNDDFWVITTDGSKIISNSIDFVTHN